MKEKEEREKKCTVDGKKKKKKRKRKNRRIRFDGPRCRGESQQRERDVNYPCSSHIPFYVSRAINSEGESAKGEEAGEEQFLHGLPRGSSLALRG